MLTKNGNESVLNGVTDWLYGEKILKSHKALWWSPNGQRLAYACFDETKMAKITYPKYGTYSDPNNINLQMVSFRYAKAGQANPRVLLFTVPLNSQSDYKEPINLVPPEGIINR
jgi:strain CBS138 chromosome J complete sequence